MKIRHSALTLFSCVLSFSGGFAQRADTLSVQEAIDTAIARNLSVTISQLDLSRSEARIREARASRYPALNLHSHYLHTPVPGYNELVTNGGEYGLQLSTSFPLYDGGLRSAIADQSFNGREQASLGLEKKKIELAFAAKTLCYDILLKQEELAIRSENVARLNDYISLLRQLRLGGTASASDVLKAQVDANSALVLLDESRQAWETSKLRLASLLGAPTGTMYDARELTGIDTNDIPGFSVESNPDYRLLLDEQRAASYDVAIAGAERLPTLSIQGDAGALGVTPDEFHQDFGYSVLLSLDFPIFTWGAVQNRIEQKEIVREQIRAQIELLRRELETEWRASLGDLQLARRNLANLSRSIADAEQNYLSAKSRFAGGSGSNLEVLDAQRLLVEAKLDYARSIFQLRSDLASLTKLSGRR